MVFFSVAANALPSDMLYQAKIHVNENIESFFSIADKGNAGFEARLASRRLGEVEKLAEKKGLTPAILENALVRFNNNMRSFRKISLRIEEKDQSAYSETLARLESSLDAHKELLKKIENKNAYEKKLNELLEAVKKELLWVSAERRSSEENSFGKDGTEGKSEMEGSLESSEERIAEAKKIVDSKKKDPKFNIAEAEEKLKEAIAHLAEGKAKLEIPEYADAFALFKRAEREAASAKMMASF
jgi:hypothetical protein